jgi:osmotically-inducible protein OsmY
MTSEEASAYIDKVDAQRRAWTLFLYGVDWLNPSLYDLTLNLEGMSIAAAVDIAATAARHRRLSETDKCLESFGNMLLASRTRAELAADPRTSPFEIEVKANAATAVVSLIGRVPADLRMQAISIAGNVTGVQSVEAHSLKTIDSE